MFERAVFRKEFTVLKKVIVKLLGIFGGPSRHLASPAVIQRPHNDLVPRELCPPVAPGLEFTHVPSFACTGGLRKLRADCSTVGLYCITITWQQIGRNSLYIAVSGVLLHETVERTHRGR